MTSTNDDLKAVRTALTAYQRAVRSYDKASSRDGTSPESDSTRLDTEEAAARLAETVSNLLSQS